MDPGARTDGARSDQRQLTAGARIHPEPVLTGEELVGMPWRCQRVARLHGDEAAISSFLFGCLGPFPHLYRAAFNARYAPVFSVVFADVLLPRGR